MNVLDDITAVTVNWLTARRTLGAIKNFKKYYPDIPLIVVDDDSKEEDRGEFFHAYNGHDVNPDLEYDPDTSKLKNIPGVTFLQLPQHNLHPKSHGHSVDLAIQTMKTHWMYHFHSDYRLTSGGLLEELSDGLDDSYCAVGDNKTRHPDCPAVVSVAAIYNADAGKRHHVTFKPVVYHNDGHITDFPGPCPEDAMAIEAGSYYVGKLTKLGYKIKWVTNPHGRYGVHMRWTGNEDEWNQLY